MDREWELKAACRTVDPDVFFRKDSLAVAKSTCAACPVRKACLSATLHREAGLPQGSRKGIVAGLTGAQRQACWAEQQQNREAALPAPAPKQNAQTSTQLSPCGTRAAYQRHVRNKELIDDACRDANSKCSRQRRRTGSAQSVTSS